MMKIKQIAALALIATATLTAQPMTAQDKLFTLEDLNFGGTNYRQMQPKNLWLTWWGEQLMLQDAEQGCTFDAKAAANPVFSLSELGESWHSAMNARYPYPGEPLVLLKNSRQRVLYDFRQKKTVWSQTCEGEQFAQWSRQSRAVAYVKGDQLYIRTAADEERRLTTDGSRLIVYGQAVHRNEWGIDGGLFWSPDGQRLAFYRMDQTTVEDYPQVDLHAGQNTQGGDYTSGIATPEPDKYPMAGTATHQVTVGVYDVATSKTVYLQTPDAATAVYFTNIAWSPDGKRIYMFELNRAQNDCRLACYDAATGQRLAELIRETSDKYVEPLHPIEFLPWDGGKFIVQSQRDGYNHLYLYNTSGQLLRQLTTGKWVVKQVLGFNRRQKSVVYTSNEAHPLQTNLYAVTVGSTSRPTAKAAPRRRLDTHKGCIQAAVLSPSGEQAYVKYSEPETPRNIDLVATATGRTQRLLTADDPWAGYRQPRFEQGTLKAADGTTDLYYRLVKPADFDPARQYPTVVYVYGGPHAHNVDASWHWASRSWETYMAQRGYVLFILDNRGSENRGLDFEQATWHQLGQVEMQDQMQGVSFLKSLPYVDASRIGVHGWSFGGFMTISLMLNYPDVFSVGVAGGPVIDWRWYEVMYGERYMGTPQQNAEGYLKTSLLSKAANLKGRLQIITGYNDPTVVPQHCLSFLDACVKAGTQPDFFAYPGEGHNMRGHASVHLHERITRYFDDYLR